MGVGRGWKREEGRWEKEGLSVWGVKIHEIMV
jgi:hypothetical protein